MMNPAFIIYIELLAVLYIYTEIESIGSLTPYIHIDAIK